MANSNTPSGLRPVGTLGSAGYAGRIEKFYAAATLTSATTAIGIGDTVSLSGDTDADGIPGVIRGTVGGVAVGVVVGAVPDPDALTKNYRPASTARYLLVDTDPNTVYEIQESTTSATDMITTSLGGINVALSLGTLDTTTGNGKTVLSTTRYTNATSGDVQILRLSPKAGNTMGESYAKWLVRLNIHQYVNKSTGI